MRLCRVFAILTLVAGLGGPTVADNHNDLAPGTEFRDCAKCPVMVVVPAGSFDMGSPEMERGRNRNEGPGHRVTIDRPFAVGIHEVTFAEWDACVAGGGCNRYHADDRDWGRGSRPIIHVSWHDAQAYVDWLSRKTGERYRLPSEAEWEYVARAGTRTRYWSGDDDSSLRGVANCNGSDCGDGHDGTAPVGSFLANAFGLHDVYGNASEWVEDCYKFGYDPAPSDGSAWTPSECRKRVLRGGSWALKPGALRSAERLEYYPGSRFMDVGFRVAVDLNRDGGRV